MDAIDTDLIRANDCPFKYELDRYKYPHRYGLPDGIDHRDNALPYLHILNDQLGDNLYIAGSNRGFTDIATFPFVRQFAATDKTWFDELSLKSLQNWLCNLTATILFENIMNKHTVWKST